MPLRDQVAVPSAMTSAYGQLECVACASQVALRAVVSLICRPIFVVGQLSQRWFRLGAHTAGAPLVVNHVNHSFEDPIDLFVDWSLNFSLNRAFMNRAFISFVSATDRWASLEPARALILWS